MESTIVFLVLIPVLILGGRWAINFLNYRSARYLTHNLLFLIEARFRDRGYGLKHCILSEAYKPRKQETTIIMMWVNDGMKNQEHVSLIINYEDRQNITYLCWYKDVPSQKFGEMTLFSLSGYIEDRLIPEID